MQRLISICDHKNVLGSPHMYQIDTRIFHLFVPYITMKLENNSFVCTMSLILQQCIRLGITLKTVLKEILRTSY